MREDGVHCGQSEVRQHAIAARFGTGQFETNLRDEDIAQHGVHSGWQHSTLHPRHAGLPHRAAGGQFHDVAVAVWGQQVAMATVHSNSGNIFLNPQGILSAIYLAARGGEI